MKKRFLTAAAFFLSAAMLAACGNGSEASSSETAAPTEAAQESGAEADADGGTEVETQTLSLWYWQSDMEQAWNDNLIADFEAANPGVNIELTIMPWADYWQKVQTATVSDTLPDIMVMSVAYIEQYARAGVVIDLKDYIDRDLDRSEYYEFAMETTRMEDGHEYGMPWNIVENCLFYNKDMFDAAGVDYPDETWTWDDLREAAIKLTDAEKNQYGFSMTLSDEVGFDSLVYSYGGAIVSDDLKECLIDGQGAKDAINYIRGMMLDDKCMVPISADSTGISDFSTGLVAMTVDGCWSLENLATASELNWDMAPIPSGPAGRKPRAWSDSICITKSCEDPETAWSFIKFLVSEEGQTNPNLTSTRIPVYIPASLSDSFLKNEDVPCNLQVLIDELEEASPFIFRGNWGEWLSAEANELHGAFTGDLTVDEATANAKAAIQAILDEYNASL